VQTSSKAGPVGVYLILGFPVIHWFHCIHSWHLCSVKESAKQFPGCGYSEWVTRDL